MYNICYVICWPAVLFSARPCFIVHKCKFAVRPKSKIQPSQALACRDVIYYRRLGRVLLTTGSQYFKVQPLIYAGK